MLNSQFTSQRCTIHFRAILSSVLFHHFLSGNKQLLFIDNAFSTIPKGTNTFEKIFGRGKGVV